MTTLTRISSLLCAVVCGWLAFSTLAFCQDNIFDTDAPAEDSSNIFDAKPDADVKPASANLSSEDADEILRETDPIINMLRVAPPNTPSKMGDALTWTMRIKRWDEVGRLLDSIKSRRWTVEQQAEIANHMGPSVVMRLRGAESQLTKAQKDIALELFQAPAKLAQQPEWIDRAIDGLASPAQSDRLVATKRLHDSGAEAIARLTNRLLIGDPSIPPASLVNALLSFGEEGRESLRAACLVADVTAASRVHLALAQSTSNDLGAEQGAALYSRAMPSEIQQQLAEMIGKRIKDLPSAQAVEQYLSKAFDVALTRYQNQRQAASTLTSFVWRPAADGRSVMRVEVADADVVLESVARLAAHRARMQNISNTGLADSFAILLQRMYKLHPQIFAGQLDSELLAVVPAEVREDFAWWKEVYSRCNEWQLHGGSLRCLQLMGDAAVQGNLDASLGFVSKLLKDPRPVVRYLALDLIDRIDPKATFMGEEWAVETAIEMMQLRDGPKALVIGLHGELRQTAKQQLIELTGAEATLVNSAAAALKVLDEPIPTELVLIVDRLADQTIGQLIQRIRRSARGQSLPIAVLAENVRQSDRNEIGQTPGVVSSYLTPDAKQMQRVLGMMNQKLDAGPMEPSDRIAFVTTARRFLDRIADDRKLYHFYPLAKWQTTILTLDQPDEAKIMMLAGTGSADNQLALARMTGDSKLSEAIRVAAARGFGKSVKGFGMALNRSDVLSLYELYNDVGPGDQVARKATGLVLDVIEAQAGKAPWPDGL